MFTIVIPQLKIQEKKQIYQTLDTLCGCDGQDFISITAYVRYTKILTRFRGFLVILLYSVFFCVCVQISSGNCETMESRKICILSRKPRSHVRILKNRTWAITVEWFTLIALIDCHHNWRRWWFLFVISTPSEIIIFHLPSHLCTNIYSLVLTKPLQQHNAFFFFFFACFRISIRIERWMVVLESHYRARCPHNKSTLRIMMVGIAGGLLSLEPSETSAIERWFV